MARNLSDVKVGDTLFAQDRYGRPRKGEPSRLDEYVAVKIGRKYVHALLRSYYDSAVARGDDPADSHMTVNVSIATGTYDSGYGSATAFYTPRQWEDQERIATARKRLLDDLIATIEAHRRRWGATDG